VAPPSNVSASSLESLEVLEVRRQSIVDELGDHPALSSRSSGLMASSARPAVKRLKKPFIRPATRYSGLQGSARRRFKSQAVRIKDLKAQIALQHTSQSAMYTSQSAMWARLAELEDGLRVSQGPALSPQRSAELGTIRNLPPPPSSRPLPAKEAARDHVRIGRSGAYFTSASRSLTRVSPSRASSTHPCLTDTVPVDDWVKNDSFRFHRRLASAADKLELSSHGAAGLKSLRVHKKCSIYC
jgi:hypothetical protein